MIAFLEFTENTMRISLLAPALLSMLATGPAISAEAMPTLLPLSSADQPQECGCSFGAKKGETLLFWRWEDDKQHALIREESGGLRKLQLYSEKYFPAQHEPPRPGDRMTLLFSYANWNIQTASEVSRACSPKEKRCVGTDYRNLIVLQWSGRQRTELRGWAHCGCPVTK
jgi:hypothetical protein